MRRSWVVGAAVCAVSLGLTAGCRGRGADAGDATGVEPMAVTTEPARQQTFRVTINGNGLVAPAAAGDWTITAAEMGRVLELPKHEGDAVAVGDVLVRFEYGNTAADASARELEVAAATSRLDLARAQLTRVTALADRGYVSKSELEAAKSSVASAELDVNRAKRQLDAVKEAADRGTIRARFAGVVAKVFHAEGDLVSPSASDPVLRVIDPTRLEVSLSVPVQQAAAVQLGMPATIISANGAEPGSVLSRVPVDDPQATSQSLRLAFAQPTTLPVDSPVQAEILIAQRKDAVALPVTALLQADGGGSYVMIAGDDGRAHRRDVRLGLRSSDRVEIVSGLTPGEHVIVKNAADVAEGTPVTTGASR